MAIPKPIPLYPTYIELKDVKLDEFPDIAVLLSESDKWKSIAWHWGQEFLSYIGRNKSEHTYTRFRSELEKFLLWAFLIKDKSIDQYRKSDILEYADFSWQPPLSWICLANVEKFQIKGGLYLSNKDWLPYRLMSSKADNSKPDKKKYKPSQESLHSMFTAINAFYKHLTEEEYCFGNPVQLAKKDCRYLIKDAQVKTVKRLSESQWEFLLSVAQDMADNDSRYERNLFLIASLKSLFLRISEYSERKEWSPVMSHFWEDNDNNWWLKIYGKGRKVRDITVPSSFLAYLIRYRLYRGLNKLPVSGENYPIIEKLRGRGGMTARQLSNLVQEVFDQAYESMKSRSGEDSASKFKEATSHWLRHTGASLEVERGRALKDVSEDLGHASMSTTDTIYVQADDKKRAASGKNRSV